MRQSRCRLSRADLDFLLQRPQLGRVARGVEGHPKLEQRHTQSPRHPQGHLEQRHTQGHTQLGQGHRQGHPAQARDALAQLRNLIFKKSPSTSDRISALFQKERNLYTTPAAVDLIIQHYLWQQDFTTAHRFLLESLPAVPAASVVRFVEASAHESENSGHISSVLEACKPHFEGADMAAIAARALVGFKYLQEHAKHAELQAWVRARRLHHFASVNQARVFELYVEKRYDEALEMGRVVKAQLVGEGQAGQGEAQGEGGAQGKGEATQGEAAYDSHSTHSPSPTPSTPSALSLSPSPLHPHWPYKWALIVACRTDFRAVETVLDHTRELHGLDPWITNIMLSLAPPLTPQISASEWFDLCASKQWPLNSGSILPLVDQMTSRYPELGQRLWNALDSCLKGRRRKWPLRMPGLAQSGFRKSMHKHNNANMDTVSQMRRNGIVPSYEFYEHLYEALVKSGRTSELATIEQHMAALHYPVHCAGTDLCRIEQQIEAAPQWARLLLVDYLTQYPLSVHDTLYLTRIALIYLRVLKDTDSAAHVADYRRLCTPDQRYTPANHDAASLMVLLQCKTEVDAWIYELLSHSPAIHLDRRFRQAVREHPALEGNNNVRAAVLQKVRAHNEALLDKLKKEIEGLVGAIE